MEEGLRCKGLAAVVGEVTRVSLNASRRLQLCAEETGVTSLILRRWRSAREKELANEPNAAATRWRVSPHPSLPGDIDSLERQHWRVELLRVRGGEPHQWILEACDAAGHLAIPAALAERSAAADKSGHRRAG
jgi:protein ImuA